MKSNLINIFNRLTSSELADYNLFDDILEHHYEKFRYLYSLIEDIDLNKIGQIYCKAKKNILRVIIEPNDVADMNTIICNINQNRNNYIFSKYLKLDIIESQSNLLIEIGVKNNKKEGDIYDNRFI